ncbi:hypothetical protein FIV42_15255 [Persicimonas caeni]|uniref:DUF91 domain-containing protein n=1 Tax=Persicimonas caeni TaxID=2292766 RepID=A0A4Y6PVA8_PERCE|nr:hypothetical protein [Persicimonas caeni]QDG52049.1 hypothetical protein FIV42_15255 [Persicimonas caeni]QED33270.1 hypothetical protein FRD00_15250 [Persicimonas caeni]
MSEESFLQRLIGAGKVMLDEFTRSSELHRESSREHAIRPPELAITPEAAARRKAGDTSIRYWLWVAGSESYLDFAGNERPELDPDRSARSAGWWTCDSSVLEGDLIMLYRKSPKSDIAYILQATSDAWNVGYDPYGSTGEAAGCEWQPVAKLDSPIPNRTLRSAPELADWHAQKVNFIQRSFPIPAETWDALLELADRGDRESGEQKSLPTTPVESERDLEERLKAELHRLEPFGYELELWRDEKTGKTGQQLVLATGGRLDLLCIDKRTGSLVVLELKNVGVRREVVGQVTSYMGSVKEEYAAGRDVVGLIVGRGTDAHAESSINFLRSVNFIDVAELGFE